VRTVYLPAGGQWIDFWTGARHAGGQVAAAKAGIATIPLFARATADRRSRSACPRAANVRVKISLASRPSADYIDCTDRYNFNLSSKGALMTRPPLPPFTRETAIQKVRMAEDGWNTRNPEKVSLAYTEDCRWRNRAEFVTGRAEIVGLLTRKWTREQEYRLIKELWAFEGNRIAVRFAYEYHDDSGQWYRAYGNENWEFDDDGLMRLRLASINEAPIAAAERKFFWDQNAPRPADHPGLSDFGF
jgi:nuclear transport factor 2 (NTF2) superfamily protein